MQAPQSVRGIADGRPPALTPGLVQVDVAARRREFAAFAVLILFGTFGVLMTMLGLDPANEQQLSDFERFYFPAMQAFAADPLAALPNYNAAPTPLYFVLQGSVLALFGDPVGVRAASIMLGVGVGIAVWTFPASRSRRMAALAVLLVSPYFRGQVWHANGDVLALLLMLLALRLQPRPGSGVASVLLTSVTVYVRQSFFFLPFYVWLRGVFKQRWPLIATTLVAALAAAPMIGLVKLWGGIAPPRYAGHLSPDVIPATLGVGLTIAALYVIPIIVMRAMRPSRLIADVRSLPIWTHLLILGAAVFYGFTSGQFEHIKGGGTVFVGLKAVEGKLHLPLAAGFIPAFVVSAYALAIVVRRQVWTNILVLLAALSMSISVLIYQRYFDPLVPLLLLLHARRPEFDLLERKGLTWVMVLPPAVIAIAASLTH